MPVERESKGKGGESKGKGGNQRKTGQRGTLSSGADVPSVLGQYCDVDSK